METPQFFSFEEFKLYYESAEKVTERRLRNNELNLSICIAVVLATALAWNWSLSNSPFMYVIFVLTAIISSISLIFSSLWIRQIRDFKTLNKVKFEILEKMAPQVYFPTQNDSINVVSFQPFLKEWDLVKVYGAVRTSEGRHGVAGLKSTTLEYFLPNAFRIVFGITFFVSLIPIIVNLPSIIEAISKVIVLK